MSGEPGNIVLHYLRRIDGRLDALVIEMADVKHRLQSLEEQFAVVRTDIAGIYTHIVRLDHRLDRVEGRLDRIENRLGLLEA
jgi:septal ring factor EnvC (AmiA/AmiB activator)